MAVTRIEPDEVAEISLRTLGLEHAGVDLSSPEARATALRRAASFLCPATAHRIVQAVFQATQGLPGSSDETKTELEEALNRLIGCGDILELPTNGGQASERQIFLGPPAFIPRASGDFILVGTRPDGGTLLDHELSALIEYDNHLRRLIGQPDSDALQEILLLNGLIHLDPKQWLKAPRVKSADEFVRDHLPYLQAAGPAGEILGLKIVDSSTPVHFYRGRWRSPTTGDDGLYVARRPQAYGADLWCFASISNGVVDKLIDLPTHIAVTPAADEAWRLQAALDALAGRPQIYEVRAGMRPGLSVIDFFSPLPSWSQRRLDILGTPLLRSRGALLSYAIREDEVDEELLFLQEMLWMNRLTTKGRADDRY